MTPPRIVGPRRIVVPCEGSRGTVVEFNAGATDNCDPGPIVTCTPPSGSFFPIGSNTVSCIAVDADGNRSATSFPVIVLGGCGNDNCLTVVVPPSNIVVRCTSPNGAIVTFTANGFDTCRGGGPAPVVCNPPGGSVFPIGLTRVVCGFTNGINWAAGTFLVEVIDDTPPTIHCPSNIQTQAQSPLGAVVSFTVTGSDDCAPTVRVKCEPPSGSVFPVGDTTVHCEAADGHGNASRCSFVVSVLPPRPFRITPMAGNQMELRWPGDAAVESTDALGDDAIWNEVPGMAESNGMDRVLRIAPTGAIQFFRLRPRPLLPPPDGDNDGIPNDRDRCPGTPAGVPVNSNGCALLQFIGQPNAALTRQVELWEDAIGKWEVSFPGSPVIWLSNRLADVLGEHDFTSGVQIQSNLLSQLRKALTDFQRDKMRLITDLLNSAPPLDAMHADVRPQDLEVLRHLELEESLMNALTETEQNFMAISNILNATRVTRPRERVMVQSFDPERRLARLTDGRLLLLPNLNADPEAPFEQIEGVMSDGSELDVEVSQLPDGSLFGQTAESPTAVDSSPVVEADPRCLALRIVPADAALPNYDAGIRHHPRGYEWEFYNDASAHYLEYGMALAVVKVNCALEQPGAYKHWVTILVDHNSDGTFVTLAPQLREDLTPFVLEPSWLLPKNTFMPRLVREFRKADLGNGIYGTNQLVYETTYVITLRDFGGYASAFYSRTIFELEDWPNETGFEQSQVINIFRSFPLSSQTLAQQTFTAWSYKMNGNSSSYPGLQQIGLNQPFAVRFQDPNDNAFFVPTNDLRKALNSPILKGMNHARPFQYRVKLPVVVRDRVHNCTGFDSYYRIPFIGPLLALYGPWSVSRGNNGTFTHGGWQKYAFDFPAAANTGVLAARGGIVHDIRETGCFSCWDPDAPNGQGGQGACVTGMCQGDYAANFVRILHQDGSYAEYFHFKKNGVQVSKGQRVYRGDFIGSVGTTGCSTGNHVHLHVLNKERTETIPIRFEAFDSGMNFRECYLPPSNSNGFSTNEPWNWPF